MVIFGTNIEESIISSVLSVNKLKVLNIDIDKNYCSSQQTMSFRELKEDKKEKNQKR